MNLSELADHPGVVAAAYFLVFVPWTAVASLDFISAHWKSVRDSRHDAQYHLFFAICPLFLIVFYIVAQTSAGDYKEMAAAYVALIFSLHHVARTVWAIAQLHAFRSWAGHSILALREHGIEYKSQNCNPAHDDVWDIADCLLVNEEVIDNQLLHGSPRCYLQIGNNLDVRVKMDAHLHGVQRILRNLAARILNVTTIITIPARIVWHLVFYTAGVKGYEKANIVRQVPHEPIALWLTWATVFVSQGLSEWVNEFSVATPPDLSKSEETLEEKFLHRRAYFAGEVLASAIFHTMPPVSPKTCNKTIPNPFTLLHWDHGTDTAQGRLTKQDLLCHALLDGRALPFQTPHPHAKDKSESMGYSLFAIKLQRITEGMPDQFGLSILDFDVERLEWLAILLHIGLCSMEQRHKSSSNSPGKVDASPSTSVASEAPELVEEKLKTTDTAVRNLCHQLGFPKTADDEADYVFPLQSAFPFPLLFNCIMLAPCNRLVTRCAEYVDAWLALNAGDDILFLQDQNPFFHHSNFDEGRTWELERKGLYESFQSEFQYQEALERTRMDFQFARAGHRNSHLDNSLTFMGYGMEQVRTVLAQRLHSSTDEFHCEEWEDVKLGKSITVGKLSDHVAEYLFQTFRGSLQDKDRISWIKTCTVTELQKCCEDYLSLARRGKSDEREVIVILTILSFPSLCVNLKEGKHVANEGNGEIAIEIDPSSAKINRQIHATIAAPGSPQNVHVIADIREASVSVSLRLGDATSSTLTPTMNFKWKLWRDAFTARLKGRELWQIAHKLASVPVFPTTNPFCSEICVVPTPMSGTGPSFYSWSGWQPFRPGFVCFELHTPEFLMQAQPSQIIFQEHYSWLDDEFTASDLHHQPRQAVKYKDADRSVLRYASLIVQDRLYLPMSEDSRKDRSDEALLLLEAQELLKQHQSERAIFLLEIGASELGFVSSLQYCVEILLDSKHVNMNVGRATAILKRYIAYVERQPCVTPKQMDERANALKMALPIFQRVVDADSMGSLPHFVAFVRMVPSFWDATASKEFPLDGGRVSELRCELRRAFLVSGDFKLITNLAQVAYDKQRTWASSKESTAEDGCDFLSKRIDRTGKTYGVVHLKMTKKYLAWKEDNGLIFKFSCLRRVVLELDRYDRNRNPDIEDGAEYAFIHLAHMLRAGFIGAAPDWKEAFDLYQRALEIRYRPDALYFQGVMLKDGGNGLEKNVERALECFDNVSTTGFGDRAVVAKILVLLMNNSLSPEDKHRSFDTLKSIVKKSKSPMALFNVSHMMTYGMFGMEVDLKTAKDLLIRAMELGGFDATRTLAETFFEDELIDGDDVVRAVELSCRAIVENQNVLSMYTLGNMLWKGQIVKTDLKLARDLFETAMQGGELSGAHNLAVMYNTGYEDEGIPKNNEEAIRISRQSLEVRHDPKIMMVLGSILCSEGRSDDERFEGVELLEQSVQQFKNVQGMFQLAMIYEDENDRFFNGPRSHELMERIQTSIWILKPFLDLKDKDGAFHTLTLWFQDKKREVDVSWKDVLELWGAATERNVYQLALLALAKNYKLGRYGVGKNEQKASELMNVLIDHSRWSTWEFRFTLSNIILDEEYGFSVDKEIGMDMRYSAAVDGPDNSKCLCAINILEGKYGIEADVCRAVNLLETIIENSGDGESLSTPQSEAYVRMADLLFVGREPFVNRDVNRGRKILEKGARDGNSARCMRTLGKVLMYGLHGIEAEPETAEKLFERCIENHENDVETSICIAELIRSTQSRARTLEDHQYIMELCERQVRNFQTGFQYSAKFLLAIYILHGLDQNEDAARAQLLLEELIASEDNDTRRGLSKELLAGILLLAPRGATNDEERGKTLFKEAQSMLGLDFHSMTFAARFFEGRDLQQDVQQLLPQVQVAVEYTDDAIFGAIVHVISRMPSNEMHEQGQASS